MYPFGIVLSRCVASATASPPYSFPHPPHPNQHPPGSRKGLKAAVSEVAEESEGWFRLRTISHAWNSDEEGEGGVPEDLRNKLKVRVGSKGDL